MNPKMQEARETAFQKAFAAWRCWPDGNNMKENLLFMWNAAIEAAAKAARDGLYGGFAEREYLIERVLALKDPTP